MTNATKSQW